MSKKNAREFDVGMNSFEFSQNILVLEPALKDKLTKEGLDWRFIDGQQFRTNGNMHKSYWKPYVFQGEDIQRFGATAEGIIQRKELVLAVRPKAVTAKHKQHVARRNAAQAGVNKAAAADLRKSARDYGVGEQTEVYEGYEEND